MRCVLRSDAAHSQGDLRITGIDVKPKILAWKGDSGLDVLPSVKFGGNLHISLTIGSPLPSSKPLRLL